MVKTIIAKVRLLSTAKATDREFDYLCPSSVSVSRGDVVKVPFGKGNRERYAVVVEVTEEVPSLTLKSILAVLPSEMRLNEEMLALCNHLKEQIFCTYGDAARAILPSVVYRKEAKTVRLLSLAKGVDAETVLSKFRGKNKEKYLSLLQYLSLSGTVQEKQCKELFDLDSAAISFLSKKGFISVSYEEKARDPFSDLEIDDPPPSPIFLSAEQEKAFATLKKQFDRKMASAALLYGVTGSGKTQVMLALCDHALKEGKNVIFLVPEIALTGQSAKLLHARYKDKVTLIHSALSEGERRDAYIAISRGEKPIVLGTRSAIFAPLENLGLIIIDEEQDQSYKSDTQLKFHARDVARFRCAKNGAMLLLASATPDIESYHKAITGKYTLIQMKERFGVSKLPKVSIVDLRADLRRDPSLLIGEHLKDEIGQNLKRGEQTILLMNRRGYRRFV
ncbi:MAG: primosomal protein N', partial [Clostridia bacterium]|nr:primosomal protein N' [Clostridia bacterium]